MNYYLITGTSRGLGEALARNLLEPGNTLFCFSRSPNPGLETRARESGLPLHYLTVDLTDLGRIDALLLDCFGHMGPAASITLFNNAGIVDPVGPIDTDSTRDIANNIRINLTAVMVVSSVFIRLTAEYDCDKTIVNISSGAGKQPYDGWGPYCAAKAGVDMFTRCLAEEQKGRGRPVRVLSIAPGVVDTDIQRRVREIDESLFRQKEKFLRLQREGRINSPDQAARNLLRALRERELPGGSVVDLWNMA